MLSVIIIVFSTYFVLTGCAVGVKAPGQSQRRVAVCGTPSEFLVFGKWSPHSTSKGGRVGGGPKPPQWWEGGATGVPFRKRTIVGFRQLK